MARGAAYQDRSPSRPFHQEAPGVPIHRTLRRGPVIEVIALQGCPDKPQPGNLRQILRRLPQRGQDPVPQGGKIVLIRLSAAQVVYHGRAGMGMDADNQDMIPGDAQLLGLLQDPVCDPSAQAEHIAADQQHFFLPVLDQNRPGIQRIPDGFAFPPQIVSEARQLHAQGRGDFRPSKSRAHVYYFPFRCVPHPRLRRLLYFSPGIRPAYFSISRSFTSSPPSTLLET